MRNVVLVHGGFVDGSGRQPVYDLLVADGFRVTVVQNPTLSLEDGAGHPPRARRGRHRARLGTGRHSGQGHSTG
ncbi:hypothetical protein ABT061_27750 [Streptosporangium sp. NPDC002544]|uniref:hypothetical protein n=1 Tax=Streptosporangium sp. NPDC002544 TaxID=3154538 RepID=UPI0033226488